MELETRRRLREKEAPPLRKSQKATAVSGAARAGETQRPLSQHAEVGELRGFLLAVWQSGSHNWRCALEQLQWQSGLEQAERGASLGEMDTKLGTVSR